MGKLTIGLDVTNNAFHLATLLHCLKGSREGTWSITVSANWRLTFQFIEGNVHILNYEDYH